MKIRHLVIPSLLMGLSLSAVSEDQYYVGLDSFYGQNTERAEDTQTIDSSTSSDAGGGAITIGKRYVDGDRFEVGFTKVEAEFDGGREEKFEGIDFDWTFLVLDKNVVQPYLEAGFGLYEYKGTENLTSDNKNLGGIAINFGAGVIYEAAKNVELDASYSIKGIGWEEAEYENGDSAKLKEDIGKFVFGARYLF